MSSATAAVSPLFNAPTLSTMSISCATVDGQARNTRLDF
jgi:hypothetical protein